MSQRYLVSLVSCLLVAVSSGFLSGCASGRAGNYAPVVDVSANDVIPTSGMHRVMTGETVYEIAWRYGLDYRDLASRNHIEPPYAIHPGDSLYLRGRGKVVTVSSPVSAKPGLSITPAPGVHRRDEDVVTPAQSIPKASPILVPDTREPNNDFSTWRWPLRGGVHAAYRLTRSGVSIYGKLGEPVIAVGRGKVVYAGNGLRSYGNLLIIKHNAKYLSAYANNQTLLVKEGDFVNMGQTIASMGQDAKGNGMLYFEIREGGRSINPLRALKN